MKDEALDNLKASPAKGQGNAAKGAAALFGQFGQFGQPGENQPSAAAAAVRALATIGPPHLGALAVELTAIAGMAALAYDVITSAALATSCPPVGPVFHAAIGGIAEAMREAERANMPYIEAPDIEM
jgi:hypothetical protein